MIKISGRHKSVPRELKKSLSQNLPSNVKVVMSDIFSCRHRYKVGFLRVIEEDNSNAKIRGYYGNGVANFFIRFSSQKERKLSCLRITHKFI